MQGEFEMSLMGKLNFFRVQIKQKEKWNFLVKQNFV